jgi:hypothetical protein
MVVESLPFPKQLPLETMLTGKPDDEVAATGKEVPFKAVRGAEVVTVMIWLAFWVATV